MKRGRPESRAREIFAAYRELRSLAAVAKRFGVTTQRVSQVVRKKYPAGAVALKREAA